MAGDLREFVGFVGATLTVCADTLEERLAASDAPLDAELELATAIGSELRSTADLCVRLLDVRRPPSDPPPPTKR